MLFRSVLRLGSKTGLELSVKGRSQRVQFENITVTLSALRHGRPYDITVILVTPTADLKSNRKVFEKLLASLEFQ